MDLRAIATPTTVPLTLLLSQTRIFYTMAHDGSLPLVLAKLHSQTTTPWVSTLISGIFCALISGICPVDILGETTSTSALITYILIHISVVIMRLTHRNISRDLRIPLGA
ncbi:unnamed protein product [Rotaria sp. Silwood2]|nr:unnamed protein product [Rotaria sp. Silwood2]CAF2603723.1 unnamed protein product [Rotaria sp. Silwood2]CAF2829570.1 unnamed protein product [Rotaria sp. Silwood2]CAF3937598.1 unnamed protein product [Rotaria sp. Silwood2]CAF3986920.1 unnamed protein product [Rotaria sp. Silwood2]